MANALLGELFGDESRKIAAWQKAQIVPNYDPRSIRKDRFGWWIVWDEHGKLGEYGWEVDHIHPRSLLGSDHESNLEALHWRNNRAKSNNLL